jgi:(1->4)-alpha-D-glucan 1-alpha-D-glucosylmutase
LAERRPGSLNTTSTHDTKRGEDVRSRINVLSEIPKEWERHLKRWSRLNGKEKKRVNALRVPDKNDEYFLYQTLIGALPFDEGEFDDFVKRIREYAIKAVREAKVHTAWLKPDAEYEAAYLSFLERILRRGENPFLGEFFPFQRKIARYGIYNSLSQTLIKATAPGVPDFYQGSELWDLSLVDPDNRRPVDFEKRKRYLQEIIERSHPDIPALIEELLRNFPDGKIKLFLTHRVLRARKEHPELFQEGAYLPLKISGTWKDHLFAFARKQGSSFAVTLAPRWLTSLVDETRHPIGPSVWQDTSVHLPPGAPHDWVNAVTGQELQGDAQLLLGDAFLHFPGALLLGGKVQEK